MATPTRKTAHLAPSGLPGQDNMVIEIPFNSELTTPNIFCFTCLIKLTNPFQKDLVDRDLLNMLHLLHISRFYYLS